MRKGPRKQLQWLRRPRITELFFSLFEKGWEAGALLQQGTSIEKAIFRNVIKQIATVGVGGDFITDATRLQTIPHNAFVQRYGFFLIVTNRYFYHGYHLFIIGNAIARLDVFLQMAG